MCIRENDVQIVFPFVHLVNKWTEGKWPIGGSWEENDMKLLANTINTHADPHWDHKYMQHCLGIWQRVAKKHKGDKKKGRAQTCRLPHCLSLLSGPLMRGKYSAHGQMTTVLN